MKDYSLRNEKSRLIQATATSLHEHITELFENGYDQGYADALRKNAVEESDKAYQQGLEDAWEAARKLALSSKDGGLNTETIAKIFDGLTYYTVFETVSASEVISNIKEYEDKQKQDTEIQVGDEVVMDDKDRKAVVSRVLDDAYNIVFYNGDTNCVDRCFIAKTGRHFDAIAEVLAEMRGESE